MNVKILQLFLGFVTGSLCLGNLPVKGSPITLIQDSQRPEQFQLISPVNEFVISSGSILFQWESGQKNTDSLSSVDHYVITFWSKNRSFGQSYSIPPADSGDTIQYKLADIRSIFRRHGEYFWQVKIVNKAGLSTFSRVRNFIIAAPKIRKGLSPLGYFYGVQLQYHYRGKTPGFRQFLEGISPKTGFESFYELGFIFSQDKLILPFLDLQEKLFILSQIGIGWEIRSRILLHKNLYFAVYPKGSYSSSWFSTGIKDFSSTLKTSRFGCDIDIMPKGFMVLKGNWIADYNIRYLENNGKLRTFIAKGWEFGLRLVLSHTIVKPFHFLGMEFDFERFPFEIYFGQVKDEYTNTKLKMNRFNITFLM